MSRLEVESFRPRSAADYALYVASVVVGPLSWWWLVDATGEAEAWDATGYWPAVAGICFVLGLTLGGSRLPYLGATKVPLVGFLIAALIFVTHIVSSFFTTPDPSNAALLPALFVLWLPLVTVFAGSAATVGVLLNRGVGRLARQV